jgi:hypothetical protein
MNHRYIMEIERVSSLISRLVAEHPTRNLDLPLVTLNLNAGLRK